MVKEREVRLITMYADPDDPTKIGRIKIKGVVRAVGDNDFDAWVTRVAKYTKDENIPNAVINMIKTRLGIN